ncbi:MAG: YfhO family protein [Oscillospiraceae bacterium]
MEISKNKNKYYIMTVILGMAIFLISALPFVIQNGMVFYYCADFDSQQIPFMLYFRRLYGEGALPQYDFLAGEGLDFIGSYGFYNLFSPFTLIFLLLPEKAALYAIPFIIALKFGVCTLNGYIYASRFCKNDMYAVIAALLYTFSGYQMVNFTYHYLDALVFFPLLLAALEAAVTEKRRILFGLTVALCAIVNYYIFGTEVVFLVVYFLVRLTDKSFRINIKDFFCLALESVLGVLAAGFVLLPAVYCLVNSSRLDVGFDSVRDMLIYETPWRYARILQAIFLPPDIMGYTNIFPDYAGDYPHGSRFSSQQLFLPLFGISGVLAYILANKKSSFTKLSAVCLIMALIPALNSLYSFGSPLYYARWMFAPTLIFAVMTGCALENEPKYFKPGIIIHGAAVVIITVFSIISPIEELSRWSEYIAYYSMVQKYVQIIFAVGGLAAVFFIIFKTKRDKEYYLKVLAVTAAFAFGMSESYLLFGIGETSYPDWVTYSFTNDIQLEDTEYGSRTATNDWADNINLLWNKKSVYTFNSTVNAAYGDFLDALECYSGDIPGDYGANCLLSVKDLIILTHRNTKPEKIFHSFSQKYIYKSTQEYYAIYENPNFIPMGFCYDYCISEEDLMKLPSDDRSSFMLKAMVLEDTSAAAAWTEPLPQDRLRPLSEEEFDEECAKRAAQSAYRFTTDKDSCTAEIELDRANLVFFSYAYDKNFTAYVDGEKTELLRANIGFMAVPVPEGKHTVKLVYHSAERDIGIAASIIGLAGFAVYAAVIIIWRKKRPANTPKA